MARHDRALRFEVTNEVCMDVICDVVHVRPNHSCSHGVPTVADEMRCCPTADPPDREKGRRGWPGLRNLNFRIVRVQTLNDVIAVSNDARRIQKTANQTDSHVGTPFRSHVKSHRSSSSNMRPAALRNTARYLLAVCSQLKSCNRHEPRARRFSLKSESMCIRPTASAMDSTDSGSKRRAASRANSGKEVTREHVTGVLSCHASRTGMPAPSNKVGKIRNSAAR